MPNDKFKDLDDLKGSIEMGLDIVFAMRGTKYNISWNDDKPFICTCPDGDAVVFESADDLLNNYRIDGTPLKELWHEFDIYSM